MGFLLSCRTLFVTSFRKPGKTMRLTTLAQAHDADDNREYRANRDDRLYVHGRLLPEAAQMRRSTDDDYIIGILNNLF